MTTTSIPARQDVTMLAECPTTTFNNDELLEGRYVSDYGGTWTARTILQFALSGIPSGATILAADLYLETFWRDHAVLGSGVAYLLASGRTDWQQTEATWNRHKAGGPTWLGGEVQATPVRTFGLPPALGPFVISGLAAHVQERLASGQVDVLLRHVNESLTVSGTGNAVKYRSASYSVSGMRPELHLAYS